MIEVDVERWDVTIRMVGIVRDNDWDAAVSMLEQKLGPPASWHVVSAGSRLRVLMDWENLEVWRRRPIGVYLFLHGKPGSCRAISDCCGRAMARRERSDG